MKHLSRISGVLLCAILIIPLFSACKEKPAEPKIKMITHKGYWTAPEAKDAQNSILSFKLAQDIEVWGSEFDVNITKDHRLIVNHDRDINGKIIKDHTYDELKDERLKDGSPVSTLDDYFEQGRKHKTVLELELKSSGSEELDSIATVRTLELMKKYDLYDPKRVEFQAFSFKVCKQLAEIAPEFSCLYLSGDLSPEEVEKAGLNGVAYSKKIFREHPEWVKDFIARGIKTDVWVINDPEEAKEFIEMGLEQIETDQPLMLRAVLGNREQKAE